MKRAVGVFELLAEEIRVRCRVVNPVLDAHNPGSVFRVSGAGFQGQGFRDKGLDDAGFRVQWAFSQTGPRLTRCIPFYRSPSTRSRAQ
jgi:hypothetical protein